MKILVTGDWHADWTTSGVRRFQDVADAVEEAKSAARVEGIDLFIFAGDLTDPDSGAAMFDALELAAATAIDLHRAGIESVWIPGNHDVVEDGSGRSVLRPVLGPLSRLTADSRAPITLLEGPSTIPVAGADEMGLLVALPFTPTSHRYDPEAFIGSVHETSRTTSPIVVVGHLSIAGAQIGDETTEMPRGRDVAFPIAGVEELRKTHDRVICFNGHYHRRQTTSGIHIPGALARLTFGEKNHEPGFLIAEV